MPTCMCTKWMPLNTFCALCIHFVDIKLIIIDSGLKNKNHFRSSVLKYGEDIRIKETNTKCILDFLYFSECLHCLQSHRSLFKTKILLLLFLFMLLILQLLLLFLFLFLLLLLQLLLLLLLLITYYTSWKVCSKAQLEYQTR